RERIDEETGQDARQQTERGERKHGRQREAVGLVRALGGLAARAAEKGDAKRLDEAGGGQRGGERKQSADGGDQELQAPGVKLRALQNRLEGQPLGDEAVPRRERRDGASSRAT